MCTKSLGGNRGSGHHPFLGDLFLSSAGAGNCARPMRLPDPSPVLDKHCAPMGPSVFPVGCLGKTIYVPCLR